MIIEDVETIQIQIYKEFGKGRDIYMSINNKLKALFEDKETIKIVSNQGEDGVINSTPKGSLEITGEEELSYVEILESSRSYKNSVYSIWFDKPVSVLIIGKNRETFLLTASIERIHTCGELFEKYYSRYKEIRGFDIAGVVRLKITEIRELDLTALIEQQKVEHPFFVHYDSIAIGGK